ncbi:MAG: glycosyltransferase [Solirubrobacteraceae bacterium]
MNVTAEEPPLQELIEGLRARFPRVAIAHDWLTLPGGSEQVLLELIEMFPHSELFTSVYDPEPWGPAIRERPVHASWLNRVPRAKSLYPKLLPLMSAAFESFDLGGFDLVISSSHACAKNVKAPPGVPHVCYCHTPMRYAWDPAFLEGEQIGLLTRALLPAVLSYLRKKDLAGATRPSVYVANSQYVADRIQRIYGRAARVVHPTVDVDRFLPMQRSPGDYYLTLGRVVPYKRVDLAVRACAQLGVGLKVAGDGRALDAAKELAGPQTEFLGRISDAELPDLLAGARALLFCAEEDFGIVPVEAQAAGVPVIAYGVGGARETVLDGETGVLYPEQSVASLVAAIERFEGLSFADERLRSHARDFSPEHFRAEMARVIQDVDGDAGVDTGTAV